MDSWKPNPTNNFVEAIEEGKIVRVSEKYAIMEGLPILKKPQIKIKKPRPDPNEEEHLTLEDFRKPLNWQKSQVISELVENFHWKISKKRKELGLTRKQVATAIAETENNIKLIENGILPKSDFIIINKLQSYLKINLRKDQQDFSRQMRDLIEQNQKASNKEKDTQKQKHLTGTESLLGDDIEIIE